MISAARGGWIKAGVAAALLPLCALPSAAQTSAQTPFERLETAVVSMTALMFEGMVARTPALAGNLPSPEWSNDLRRAYTCLYEGYVAQVGTPAVTDLVARMEEIAATATPNDILAGGGAMPPPNGLSDVQAAEIVNACGVAEAYIAHISSTGALDLLLDP